MARAPRPPTLTAEVPDGRRVNVGFSPGDTFSAEPILYVGPHDAGSLADPFWNAPFGAYVTYEELRGPAGPGHRRRRVHQPRAGGSRGE